MLERYLIVWLTVLCGLAFFWPDLLPDVGDPFVASKPVLPYLISVTMFAVGCLMRRDELRQVMRDWRSVLAGTIIQYTATPLLAYTFGHLCGLDEAHLIGVMIVGCVPGAMASNVLTMVARGNVSYSVSLTTVSTIVSPVVVPLAMSICLKTTTQVDVWDTAGELLMIVVGPVLLGRVLCRFEPRLQTIMDRVAPILAPVTILWIISSVVGANRHRLGEGVWPVVVALAGINLVGYLVGYFSGAALGFSEGVRRALTIELGMQNAGLGVALAAKLFPDYPAAMVPPALFTFGSMVTATLLAQWWARQARRTKTNGTTDNTDTGERAQLSDQ
ncbi:MAG: bile acid:sodium symporter family protein [Planctomycetaceae bacterium]|nr:bile acid:sodium symporter family protein [Planctomycetaceae bacterium]